MSQEFISLRDDLIWNVLFTRVDKLPVVMARDAHKVFKSLQKVVSYVEYTNQDTQKSQIMYDWAIKTYYNKNYTEAPPGLVCDEPGFENTDSRSFCLYGYDRLFFRGLAMLLHYNYSKETFSLPLQRRADEMDDLEFSVCKKNFPATYAMQNMEKAEAEWCLVSEPQDEMLEPLPDKVIYPIDISDRAAYNVLLSFFKTGQNKALETLIRDVLKWQRSQINFMQFNPQLWFNVCHFMLFDNLILCCIDHDERDIYEIETFLLNDEPCRKYMRCVTKAVIHHLYNYADKQLRKYSDGTRRHAVFPCYTRFVLGPTC